MALDGQRAFILISGASRGIGRQLALSLASRVAPESAFVLTARNEKLLVSLKAEIKQRCEGAKVWILVCDLANFSDELLKAFDEVLKDVTELDPFDAFAVFHNAGSIGDVRRRALELSDAPSWHSYFQVNFISMVQLNNLVLQRVTSKVAAHRIVVNISSLVAVKGFPSLTQYSAGKAAREAFFRSLAAEETDLRVLNYAPGPVDTDMHDEVAKQSYDDGIRTAFQRNSKESKENQHEAHRDVLTPEATVSKLLAILNTDTFESGTRIDYFDA